MDSNTRTLLIASLSGASVTAAAAALIASPLGRDTLGFHGEADQLLLEDAASGRMMMDIETMVPYGNHQMAAYLSGSGMEYGPRLRGTGRSGGQQKSRDVAKGRVAAKAARKARRVMRHAK
jgi:hypothetical protein